MEGVCNISNFTVSLACGDASYFICNFPGTRGPLLKCQVIIEAWLKINTLFRFSKTSACFLLFVT